MNFISEIKQVSSKKTTSNDLEYKIVLVTNDPQVLGLGALSAETLVKVEVTADE